jgi:hypothetical protein
VVVAGMVGAAAAACPGAAATSAECNRLARKSAHFEVDDGAMARVTRTLGGSFFVTTRAWVPSS